MADEKNDPEPLHHVFDQTNGVLGEADAPEEGGRTGDQGSRSPKFGIPPITSL